MLSPPRQPLRDLRAVARLVQPVIGPNQHGEAQRSRHDLQSMQTGFLLAGELVEVARRGGAGAGSSLASGEKWLYLATSEDLHSREGTTIIIILLVVNSGEG